MRPFLFLLLFILSDMSQSREFTQDEADRYNYLFEKANQIVDPFIYIQDQKRTNADKEKLASAIEMYDEAIEINPDSWASMWFRGKAFQAMGDFNKAYDSFKGAYGVNPNNPDVVNEYVLECMNTQRHEEALKISKAAASVFPEHIGIQANLALVYILSGQQDNSIKQGKVALKLNRKDPVTKRLIQIAKKIKAGKQKQPLSIFELSNEI